LKESTTVRTATDNSRSVFKSMLKSYPDVLNVEQMCEALGGLSKKTGYKLLNENKIPSIKIGRAHKILKVSVIQYLTNSYK